MSKLPKAAKKWQIMLTRTASKQLDALDAAVLNRIRKFLHERVECADDPRTRAKHLIDTDGLFRLRVGDCRLIIFIAGNEIRVLALAAGMVHCLM